ncbi:MAG: hypothetical protein LBI10_02755 [Deltaproteobacteria bacterium]|jgi:hypothetical protein|nr:hypothetical protein [Deltaproteobacteria bacterium]
MSVINKNKVENQTFSGGYKNNKNPERSQEFFLLSQDFKLAEGKSNKPRTFTGVAYSGDVVTDQWFWDAVVFDLEGLSFSHEKTPVLRDHDRGRILGYTTRFSKEGDRLEVQGVFLGESAEAQEVVKLADEGYPWQMSVDIRADKIVEIAPNIQTIVNNQTITGPATVFAKSTIREVSFCAVGADRGASAAVFSSVKSNQPKEVGMARDNVETPTPNVVGSMERDLAIQTLSDEKNSFATKCATLEAERAKLSGESAELRAQVKSLTFELDSLKDSLTRAREEAETLRREKVEFTVKSREASLSEDYKRLGLAFDAKSESVVTILGADEVAFQAFRSTLSLIQKPKVEPPVGAFESVTPVAPSANELGAPVSALADLAKLRRNNYASEVK